MKITVFAILNLLYFINLLIKNCCRKKLNIGLLIWKTTWRRKNQGRRRWRGRTHHQPRSWNLRTEIFPNLSCISCQLCILSESAGWALLPSPSCWQAGPAWSLSRGVWEGERTWGKLHLYTTWIYLPSPAPWNYLWKPAPYADTEEKRLAAAKK